jgi:hypothetical protein
LSQVFWVKTVPASAGRYQTMLPGEAEPLDGLRRNLARCEEATYDSCHGLSSA